jgi:hypothetical protein
MLRRTAHLRSCLALDDQRWTKPLAVLGGTFRPQGLWDLSHDVADQFSHIKMMLLLLRKWMIRDAMAAPCVLPSLSFSLTRCVENSGVPKAWHENCTLCLGIVELLMAVARDSTLLLRRSDA